MSDIGGSREPSPAEPQAELPAEQASAASKKVVPQNKAARELLDRVIDRSVSQFSNWLDGESLLPVLREVARRYPNQPFSVDPVATELVVCALATFWAQDKPGAREFWRAVALPVAESLAANAHARRRLEHLWTQLNSAA